MIGARIQTAIGSRIGSCIGTDPLIDGGAPVIAGVTQDALSGKYVPASAAEWTLLMVAAGLATGNPSALYLMQEAAGNPADSIGTFTLAASGTGLSYQNAVAGWTRKAINVTDGATGVLANADAGLPAIDTQSCLILGYIQTSTVALARSTLALGVAATRVSGELTAASLPKVVCGVNTATGATNPQGQVRPFVVGINRTANSAAYYNDLEKLVPTFGATAAGQKLSYGTLQNAAGAAKFLYGAAFFLGAAELTSAQVKTLLTTLGWTGIPWS